MLAIRRLILPALAGAFLAVVSSAFPAQRGVRLNAPLPVSATGGDVQDVQAIPGAERVCYRAEGFVLDTYDLFSVPATGGSAVLLSPALPAGGQVQDNYVISPDGQTVFFLADEAEVGRFELFRSAVDGSSAPQKLNTPLVAGREIEFFRVTPGGDQVVYRGDQDTADQVELYRVAADGSGPPIKLNAALPAGSDVYGFELTPAGESVLFLAIEGANAAVYHANLDESEAHVRLASSFPVELHMILDNDVSNAKATPDGNTVILRAPLETPGITELFRVAIADPSVATKISGPTNPQGDVFLLEITPVGTRAIYTQDRVVDGTVELWSVPVDGSEAPLRLNGVSIPLGTVLDSFLIRSDSQVLVYHGNLQNGESHFYSVPILGGEPPKQLYGTLTNVETYAFTPDEEGAIYLGRTGASPLELYTVPLDLSSPPLKISGGEAVESPFLITGNVVVYQADPSGPEELFVVPVDGGSAPVQLSDHSAGGHITDFDSNDLGQLVYVANRNEGYELLSVQVDGSDEPMPIHGVLADHPAVGDVVDFNIDATGNYVVYQLRDQGPLPSSSTTVSLWAGRLDRSLPAVKLTPDYNWTTADDDISYRTSPDGQYVLYRVGALYVVRTDGSSSPTSLTPSTTFPGAYAITDDNRLVFDNDGPLMVQPLDLSAPAYEILASPGPSLQLSDDQSRVVLLSYGGAVSPQVISVRVDGTQAEDPLSVSASFEYLTQGAWVLFSESPDFNLFSAPVDGSFPRAQINAPFAAGESIQSYTFRPDTSQVAFVQGVLGGAAYLYIAPVDGSAVPVQIVAFPVDPFVDYTPDGTRILFEAAHETFEDADMYVVPSDGSAPPVLLPFPAGSGQNSWILSPDGSHIARSHPAGLYVFPIDASESPRLLFVDNDFQYTFTHDSRRLIAKVPDALGFNRQLIARDIDGEGFDTVLTPLLAFGGFIQEYAVTPDGNDVVYRASQAAQGVEEIFLSRINRFGGTGERAPTAPPSSAGSRTVLQR